MQIYTGNLVLAIGATIAHVDIDPAERSGYVNEVVGWETIADVATYGANWPLQMAALSVKVPARTAFDESNQFDQDIIARAIPLGGGWAVEDDSRLQSMILDEDAYFQNTVRILLATRDGAVAAAAETMYFRLMVEEKKLTDSIRNTINQRAYS